MSINETKHDWAKTAETLAEALPHIQAHDSKTIVIKIGGSTIVEPDSLASIAGDIALLRQCGVQPIIVHGGGPQIGKMLNQLGLSSEFRAGQRVTDEASIDIVEMVLAGSINKRIVTELQKKGGRAVGLSGKDSKMLHASRLVAEDGGDLGLVGKPEGVDHTVLQTLMRQGFIPVIAPLAWGPDGETLNVNADSTAGAIASSLCASRLLLLTDVKGVLDSRGEAMSTIAIGRVEGLVADGTIGGGMIPKARTATAAVAGGVEGAVILDGRVPHAVLLELFTDHGAGTLITREE